MRNNTNCLLLCFCKAIFLFCLASTASARRRRDGNVHSREILIENKSGLKIDVFWINPQTKELAPSSFDDGLVYGSETGLSSYVGHTFEVQEIPTKKRGKTEPSCRFQKCQKAYFTVNSNEDQKFIIDQKFNVIVEDHKSLAMKKTKVALNGCELDSSLPALQAVDAMAVCLEKKLNATVQEQYNEILFQAELRKTMGEKLVQYACQVDDLETTRAIQNKSWTYVNNDVQPPNVTENLVQVLFESDFSSLYLVANFLQPEECDALVNSSDLSEQAQMGKSGTELRTVPLSAKTTSSQVDSVMKKIQSLGNAFMKANFEYNKDPMVSIITQIAVPVPSLSPSSSQECNANEPDNTCPAPAPTKKAASLAADIQFRTLQAQKTDTAMMQIFCDVPKSGGDIHFPKAGVHIDVKDVKGYAMLMLFADMDTGKRHEDPFIEQYVECPVQDGKLVIVADTFAVLYP